MKKIALTILLGTLAAFLPAVDLSAQSRTNRLSRPCSGSTTPASVDVESDGDISLTPCSGRALLLPNVTRFIDPAYTPFYSGTNYFTIGSDATITLPAADNLTGSEIYLPFSASGTSKNYAAYRSFLYPAGSPVNPSVFGNFNYIFTNAFTPSGTSAVYGYYANVDIGFPVTNAYGGYFVAAHGSSAANGAGTITGIGATAGMGHNGSLTSAYAGDFLLSSSGSSPSTTSLGEILRGRAVVQSGVTVTDLRGLSLESWSNVGTVTTSYGIYADASIDLGATKYFIYSLSTSPSYFTGKHTFDVTNTAGGTTGNQTINKPSFSVNFAAGASSLVVTNSFVTANSYVLCTVQTNDATALLKNATPAAGSVTIRLNAAATAETRVACMVVN